MGVVTTAILTAALSTITGEDTLDIPHLLLEDDINAVKLNPVVSVLFGHAWLAACIGGHQASAR